jgi:hypothetical protein
VTRRSNAAIAAALTLGGCSLSWSERGQLTTAVVAESALAVDWSQTHYLASHDWPRDFREENPLLGKQPSPSVVGVYMGGLMVGLAASYHLLPSWSRWIVYGTVATLEIAVVADNCRHGGCYPPMR